MKFKKALVWSCISREPHPSLNKKEQSIAGVMPLIKALFPGVNDYSFTVIDFNQMMLPYVIPALKKQFPKLESLPASEINATEMVEVNQFLSTRGDEWMYNSNWGVEFKKLLAAT